MMYLNGLEKWVDSYFVWDTGKEKKVYVDDLDFIKKHEEVYHCLKFSKEIIELLEHGTVLLGEDGGIYYPQLGYVLKRLDNKFPYFELIQSHRYEEDLPKYIKYQLVSYANYSIKDVLGNGLKPGEEITNEYYKKEQEEIEKY